MSFRAVVVLSTVLGLISAGSTLADNRTLVIGIDGAGGRFLQQADTPNIDALVAHGLARYDYSNEGALVTNPPEGYGASGANWSTIATGASAAHHGVSDNSFTGNQFGTYPHYFKYLKDADPSLYTASIVNWAPINNAILADSFADLELEPAGGSASAKDAQVRNAVASLLAGGDPDAIFVHFDQVDGAGHGFGWGSDEHLSAITAVDLLVGDIMSVLNGRPGVGSGAEDWLVIITADHGGQGTSHFASQGLVNWEVPMVISGPSIPVGVNLPRGTLRDVVPTALWHMGIDPFELNLDGTVRGLEVLPPNGILADLNQDGVVSGNGQGAAESDDVTAFLAGWLTTGGGGIAERYARGDLNFDGETNLADWAILHRASPAASAAVMRELRGVPEPAGTWLWLAAAMVTLSPCGGRCLRIPSTVLRQPGDNGW